MSDRFYIYDSNGMSSTVCGIPVEGGFGEDTFIEIEYLSPAFVTKVGADGSVTRSATNDNRAKITLTLMQSSIENALLSALHNIDKNAGNGAGVGPLLIKDNQGTSLYAGEKSWITGHPKVVFSKSGEARAWEIECANLESFTGGN